MCSDLTLPFHQRSKFFLSACKVRYQVKFEVILSASGHSSFMRDN